MFSPANPDSYLTVADIIEWEKQHGRVPYGAIVIMKSGWFNYYHNDTKYYGWEDRAHKNNMSFAHFPGFSADAIEFLGAERKIVGIAVDTVELDPGIEMGTFKVSYQHFMKRLSLL